MGANIGLVVGLAFAVIGASKFEQTPAIGIALGLVVGLVLGGVLGSVLKPRSRRRAVYPKRHYSGFPPTDVEEDKAESA